MNSNDKKLILDLALKKISEKYFLKNYSGDLYDMNKHVKDLLNNALATQDPDDVEYPMLFASIFDLYNQDLSDILCKLLLQDWHYKHEDIVSIMQGLKNPSTVDALYLTAFKTYKYLDYDEFFGLARKCTWALSDINTKEAIEKLKLLAQSDNPLIKSYAEKRLVGRE